MYQSNRTVESRKAKLQNCKHLWLKVVIHGHTKTKSPTFTAPHLSHLTNSPLTKSNLHLPTSLATVTIDLYLSRILTFQMSNHMSFLLFYFVQNHQFRCGTPVCFVSIPVFTIRIFSDSPNPQAWEGPHLIGCPQRLLQYIGCYPAHCRPFLFPQIDEAPCSCDREVWLCFLIERQLRM